MKLIAAAGALTLTVGVDADSIVLKRTATLPGDAEAITLGAVAELTGPDAQQFADLAIAQRPDAKQHTVTITVQQVRAALDSARAHWGRIDLNGWKTEVQLLIADAEPPLAMTGAAIDTNATSQTAPRNAGPDAHGAQQLAGEANARGVIARTLARQLRVQPTDLRLAFDQRDHELLDLSTHQYRIELEPKSNLYSDTITLGIRAWSDTQIAHRGTINIGVQVRTNAAVIGAEVRRGHVIDKDAVTTKPIWIGAGDMQEILPPDDAIERIATQTLKPGDVLRQRDARRETLIERGDVVQVRCLVGGVVIAMQAEARADGSRGDIIEFRKLGERQPFLARVVNRNEAVIEMNR